MEPETRTSEGSHMIDVSEIRLKRRVKIWQAVAIVIGPVIGSAIYISPGVVLRGSGSPGVAILVWAAAGVSAVLGALCYAELGTTFPVSGEKYYYLEKMYGPAVSFSYMWMYMFFIRPGANAIKALTFGTYVLQLTFPDCQTPESAVKLLAILIAMLITVANIVNVEWSNNGQACFGLVSILSLSWFSLTGIVYLAQGRSESWQEAFSGSATSPADVVLAAYAAIYGYAGWNGLNFLVEEVKNPKRSLPLSICLGLFFITTLYVMTNVAYITVLGQQDLLSSPAVAVTFGQRAFPSAAWLVPIIVCICNISSYNSGQMLSSRLCFVTARRGHFPKILGLITTWSLSPVTSLLLQFICISAAILLFDVTVMIKNLVFLNILYDILVIFGMLKFRKANPDLRRPFKVFTVVPLLYLVVMSFLLLVPLLTRPRQTLVGALLSLGTSIPVYFIFIKLNFRFAPLNNALDALTRVIQKLFLCVPQEGEVVR